MTVAIDGRRMTVAKVARVARPGPGRRFAKATLGAGARGAMAAIGALE